MYRLTRLLMPFALTLSLTGVSFSGTVTLMDPGTDDRIATIAGLVITGTGGGLLDGSYDVTFQHGTTFDALSGTRVTFTSAADAAVALAATASAVDAFGDVSNLVRTYQAIVPINTDMDGRYITSTAPKNYTDWDDLPTLTLTDYPTVLPIQSSSAFLTFTAVPEPSSFMLAGMLAGVWGLYCRRRKSRTNQISDQSRPIKSIV
jgi:hypothetical protein